jgi:hypothetical protein
MKRIVLITSFCDNVTKLECLKKNIIKIKEMGLDVMVYSPIILSEEIVKLCDYFIYNKNNPVLDWPEKAIYYWKEFFHQEKRFKFSRTVPDYGWAALYQVKNLTQIASGMDYDYYYLIDYDLKMDDLKDYFFKEESKTIFPSKRENTIWDYGLHFIIFDKKYLRIFSELITQELYMKFNSGNAYDCLEQIGKIINTKRGDRFVEDEISYFEGNDLFNFSTFKDFNFFIEKNDQFLSNIKLWFYGFEGQLNLAIKSNGLEKHLSIKNFDVVDLDVNKNNIEDVELIYSSESQNITKIIKKLKHTTVEIL